MSMSNLLEETKRVMQSAGLTPACIVFIGSESSGHECSWDEFVKLADFEYDPGFGAQKVAKDLIIVFENGTLMLREEYDGSEWWRVHRPFIRPKLSRPITRLHVKENQIGWCLLSECQPLRIETETRRVEENGWATKGVYHTAMFAHPQPEEIVGCPCGRSQTSIEDAIQDLLSRTNQESQTWFVRDDCIIVRHNGQPVTA